MSDRPDIDRRRFLAGIGAAGAGVALAGCAGESERTETAPSTAGASDEPALSSVSSPPDSRYTGDSQAVRELLRQLEWQNEALFALVEHER